MTAAVADVLEAAAVRLSKRGALIYGPPEDQPFAANASGEEVGELSQDAACWCLLGGINRAAGGYNDAGLGAKDALRRHLQTDSLSDWNHARGRSKKQVLAALREAAAKARKEA